MTIPDTERSPEEMLNDAEEFIDASIEAFQSKDDLWFLFLTMALDSDKGKIFGAAICACAIERLKNLNNSRN